MQGQHIYYLLGMDDQLPPVYQGTLLDVHEHPSVSCTSYEDLLDSIIVRT